MMSTFTITTFFALFLSLLMFTSALPTTKTSGVVIARQHSGAPGTLLGRQYTRQSAPALKARANDNLDREALTRRADRFYAVQRRIARNPAAERLVEHHDKNFLSNQSMMAPQASQTPGPIQPLSQAPLAASTTSTSSGSRPTHATKHSKGGKKKAGEVPTKNMKV